MLPDNKIVILFELISKASKNCNFYTNAESFWIIDSENKVWLTEFRFDGSLYYNKFFFEKYFNYVGLDVVDNQTLITYWFEYIIDIISNYGEDYTKSKNIYKTHWVEVKNFPQFVQRVLDKGKELNNIKENVKLFNKTHIKMVCQKNRSQFQVDHVIQKKQDSNILT